MDQERYSIIFSSVTGNTKLLADALRETLPKDACDYFGTSENAPTDSQLLYVGFWTDKGNADSATLALLQKLRNKKLFLLARRASASARHISARCSIASGSLSTQAIPSWGNTCARARCRRR